MVCLSAFIQAIPKTDAAFCRHKKCELKARGLLTTKVFAAPPKTFQKA